MSENEDSKRSWTLPRPRDTTPEVWRRQQEWWLGLTGEERLEYMLNFQETIRQVQKENILLRYPGASDAEVDAIWVEETYRDELDSEFLKAAAESIRTRDQRVNNR